MPDRFGVTVLRLFLVGFREDFQGHADNLAVLIESDFHNSAAQIHETTLYRVAAGANPCSPGNHRKRQQADETKSGEKPKGHGWNENPRVNADR